ncbi:hypothetical protein [Mucilaginibacter xinganensis]|uniref:Uncharacterized protein n=1 Tax=Mucilaginibacter xinganensis TaxID=1234841 RepID=A0A223NX04_9SPHI|nr:hypothetical protein [Mucilaginibacter xinganensis]ASU34392.1 hypothetical protein MuYL_2505 [Mucilaginibacter xinganensis]
MDYKEYLLKQSAINLSYIAERMWPGNKYAKSYLSTKLNDGGRPWTDTDNNNAERVINELGLQLLQDAPNINHQQSVKVVNKTAVKSPIKKEVPKRNLLKEMQDAMKGDHEKS